MTPEQPEDDDIHAPSEWAIVMPFIVTASHGGPYDDEAYCAGAELGSINRMLETTAPEVSEISFTVRTANAAQIDLAAMHHGWTMDGKTWSEDDYWTLATLNRSET